MPLALVTDGARWTLVWAREGESTGMCTWRSELWLEEPITLRAFVTLLGARRFFALPVEEGLAALLAESAGKQQEVADQLGAQVRRAVELLDHDARLRGPRASRRAARGTSSSAEVYRGAVTVMMRLVFLFVAEERRLLPIDDPRYAETLAASTLRAQLQEQRRPRGRGSARALDRRLAPDPRAVPRRARRDRARRAAPARLRRRAVRPRPLPVPRGPPARQPAGTSRRRTRCRSTTARCSTCSTRCRRSNRAARACCSPTRRSTSSRSATSTRACSTTPPCGPPTRRSRSPASSSPSSALGELERWAALGSDTLVERLAEGDRPLAARDRQGARQPSCPTSSARRLRAACGNDDALLDRVAPYHALLREDLRGDPLVILARLAVRHPGARPPRLRHLLHATRARRGGRPPRARPGRLRPGPAQEPDPAKWKLKPAAELLELKIADIAMGSGAFLVAACRYLAARLLEAWKSRRPIAAADAAVPADPIEREALAHRLVAERCLYGVDKNPMAVEMAKLSLWLITLAKDRPFSFVDHALRAGDSLLGVTDLKQLRVAHLDPSWHRQASLDLGFDEIEAAVDRALALAPRARGVRRPRRARRRAQGRDARPGRRRARRRAAARRPRRRRRARAARRRRPARLRRGRAQHPRRWSTTRRPSSSGWWRGRSCARSPRRGWSRRRRAVGEVPEVVWDDRHPFHWALEFPEVRERGGFDAIVGNPPFQGGKKISGALGGQYRDYLVEWLAGGARGSADLVAYFYLRASTLLRPSGGFGLIATNTIAQGDTREVGLDQLAEARLDCPPRDLERAVARRREPGDGDGVGAARRTGRATRARPCRGRRHRAVA